MYKPDREVIRSILRHLDERANMPTVTKQTNKPAINPVPNGQKRRSGWDLSSDLQVLLYGESGSGKTTTWATFPGPIKALICSGSLSKPGELKSIDTPENRRKIDPVIITSTVQFCEEIENCSGQRTYVLDHVSGLLGLVMKEHLGLDDIPAVKKFMMATQADWGFINEKTIGMLRGLLALPCNVVVVSQERLFKGKDDGVQSDVIRPALGPAVTPGVASWLAPACDYVVQAFKRAKVVDKGVMVNGVLQPNVVKTGKSEYCLRLDAPEGYMLKFRKPLGQELPDAIVNPTYEKILALIAGKLVSKKVQ